MAAAERDSVRKARNEQVPASGLTTLSSEGSEDFVVDIVLVHGLGGHPCRTWTTKCPGSHLRKLDQSQASDKAQRDSTSKSRFVKEQLRSFLRRRQTTSQDVTSLEPSDAPKTVYWPQDFLAQDFPRAKVMTWGYNSNLTKGYSAGSQGTIFSHARNLLYSLVFERREASERPLVFITHSLGGIMVKEVLRRSEVDSVQVVRQILLSTSVVVFYGTPHRGSSHWASFGEGVARVATFLTGIEINANLIRCLLPSGSELEECRESFARQWQARQDSLTVRTYQEGRGPSGVRFGGFNKKIVPDESSSLDHPSQWARTIDADHREMCRFATRHDQGYLWIKADIEQCIERVTLNGSTLASRNESHAELRASKDSLRLSPDQSIDSDSTLGTHISIDPRKASFVRLTSHLMSLTTMEIEQHLFETVEPVASTFRWILQHPSYLRLVDPHTHGPCLLHITGKPGCGKTTLAAFIHREQEKTGVVFHVPQRTLFFAFNDRREGCRELVSLIASLILQLLQMKVEIPSTLNKYWDDKVFQTKRWSTFADLHWAFSTIISNLSNSASHCKVVLIVDALDECLEGHARVVLSETLVGLVKSGSSGTGLGVIVTSRPYADINLSGPNSYKLDLDMEDNVDKDLEIYIDDKISGLIRRRPGFDIYAQQIRQKLIMRGDKMYLLVCLLLDRLERLPDSSIQSVQAVLDSLPIPLSAIYDRLWTETVGKEGHEAKVFFSWILCAISPMDLRDFAVLAGRLRLDSGLMAHSTEALSWPVASTQTLHRSNSRSGAKQIHLTNHLGVHSRRSDYEEMLPKATLLELVTPRDMGGDLQRLLGPFISITPPLDKSGDDPQTSDVRTVSLVHATVREHFSGHEQFPSVSKLHLQMAEVCARCYDKTMSDDPDTEPRPWLIYRMDGTDTIVGATASDPYFNRWDQHYAIARRLDPSVTEITIRGKKTDREFQRSPLQQVENASDSDE